MDFWYCDLEGEHPAEQKVCHGMCKIDVDGLSWPVENQSGRLECDCIQRLGPIVFKGACKWKTVEEPECNVPAPTEPPGQMNFGYPENYGKTTTESPATTTTTTTSTTTTSTTEFNVVPIPCLPYLNSKPNKVPRICRDYMPTMTTTSTTTTTSTATTRANKRNAKRKFSACQELFSTLEKSD